MRRSHVYVALFLAGLVTPLGAQEGSPAIEGVPVTLPRTVTRLLHNSVFPALLSKGLRYVFEGW